MKPLYIETPVIVSESFLAMPSPVLLKLENLQPCGSFKLRGIQALCNLGLRQGFKKKHFISSSGGNAGLATAYCGKKMGIKTTVVVPKSTPLWAINKIKEQGAHIIVHGSAWVQADALAQELCQKNKSSLYIPPFDNPQILLGHSSMVLELKKQIKKPSAIILAVGGGGLLGGVIQGLKAVGWHDVKIYASETKGAACFRAALNKNQPVDIAFTNTIAVTLAAPQISAQAFILSQSHPVISKVVSDAQALHACIHFANEHRMLVEPSCGAALSLLHHDSQVQKEKNPLLIVCGGAGVSLELINRWQQMLKG